MTKERLKAKFSTGKKPTGADFAELIDDLNGDARLDNYLTSYDFELNTVSSSSRLMWNGVTHTIVNNDTVNAVVTGTSGFVGFSIPYEPNKKFVAVYKLANIGASRIGTLRARLDYRNGVNGVTQQLGSSLLTPTLTLEVGDSFQSTVEFTIPPDIARSNASFGFFTSSTSVSFSLELKLYDTTGMTAGEVANIDWVNMLAVPTLKADFANKATVAETLLNGGSSWGGKRWLTLGDSITSPGTYQNLVKEKLGFSTVNNKGIAGSAVLGMLNNVSDTDIQNTDLITLYGCFNNFTEGAPPLGTIADAPQGVMSGNTFISNLKYVIEYVLTRNLTAQFVIIGTHNGTDTNRPDLYQPVNGTNNIGDYVRAMGEVARYYGLPFIDMYGKSGINSLSLTQYTSDGLHLNAEGYRHIASVIAGELQKIEPI